MFRLLTFDEVSSKANNTRRHRGATIRNCIIPISLVDIKSRIWIPKKLTPISRYPNHAPIDRRSNIDNASSIAKI